MISEYIGHVAVGLVFASSAGVVLWRRKVSEFPPGWARFTDWLEVVGVAVLVGVVVASTVSNAIQPDPWDYPVFYTVGATAAQGDSFYDPQSLSETFAGIRDRWDVPADWLKETGFWYAPPTALYLVPLGLLDYPVSLMLNNAIQLAFFAGSIVLLHRSFPLRPGAMGLIDMTLLGLLFRPVLGAFDLAQIGMGALFCLTVATVTVTKRGWLGGLALGIGSLFKHLLIIPAVLALSIRRWRMTVVAIAALVGLVLLSGIAFGFDVYAEFMANGPGDRSPELALDPVIQSLNGELRRIFGAVPSGPGALNAILYPPYLVAGAVVTALSLATAWRASNAAWAVAPAFALLTLLALIVYPNTLYNTLPLMIPALMVTLHRAGSLGISPRVLVAFGVVVFGLVGTHSRFGFATLVLVWGMLGFCLYRMSSRGSVRRPSPVLATSSEG
jgi:hypothetical protein